MNLFCNVESNTESYGGGKAQGKFSSLNGLVGVSSEFGTHRFAGLVISFKSLQQCTLVSILHRRPSVAKFWG